MSFNNTREPRTKKLPLHEKITRYINYFYSQPTDIEVICKECCEKFNLFPEDFYSVLQTIKYKNSGIFQDLKKKFLNYSE